MTKSDIISDKTRTLIFVNIIISCIATSLLSTALTTALPPITVDFHISSSTGQWLTSAYSLVMAIMMPLTAFLITRISTRKLYISILSIFLVGTGICIIAPNFFLLMIGRIFQACSNGVTSSIAQVILLSIYPIEKRGTIMGWYGLSIGAAPVIAPTLAGIIVGSFGWRMIFVCSFVIMLISVIYACLVMKDVIETTIKKFDVVSFLLSATAFGGLTLGIGNASQGITSYMFICPLLIGVVGGIFFVYRQLHLSHPFLEIKVFKNFQFSLSVFNSMILYFIMMGSSILLPLYIQNILGYSATISGLVTLPGSLVMAFVGPIAGKIYDKLGMRKLAITGAIGLFIGTLGMFLLTIDTPVVVTAILNVIRNIAIGCLMMPLVTWGISDLNEKYTADGTALLNSLRTMAGAMGTALFVGIMNLVASQVGGYHADFLGLRFAFGIMSIIAVIMFVVAILLIKDKKSKNY